MENDFYEKCAIILNTTYECEQFTARRRTRWNNRKPGGGRFPDFGIIRHFGPNIQVALRKPVACHKIFKSEEEVLAFLETIV